MNPENPQHPQHPHYPPYQAAGTEESGTEPQGRPDDVVTGFWLWTAALPLSVIGYVINLLTTPERAISGYAYAVSGLMLFIIAVLVATFLVLLRQGYRWARSILTGGAANGSADALVRSIGIAGAAPSPVRVAGTGAMPR